MKFNGTYLKFINSDNDSIPLKTFVKLLDGIIQDDFYKKCENPVFKTKDVNKSIKALLYALLGVNVVLVVVFLILFRKVKKKEKRQKLNSIHSIDEGLLSQNYND